MKKTQTREGLPMTSDEMIAFLELSYEIKEVKPIPYGTQIKLANGAAVNVFDKGSFNVQGKCAAEVRSRIETGEISDKRNMPTQKSNKVFVVYGHNEEVKLELEMLLRRWGLEPIILDKMPSGGQTVIEKLESQIPTVEYGIVLATPDDEGYRRGAPEEKMYRCRQNVVLEMGMLLTKLGRDRVAVLQQKPKETERPSDIQGLLYIPFEEKLEPEAAKQLAKEIENKLGMVIPATRL